MKNFLLPITIVAALLCACDRNNDAEPVPALPSRTVTATFTAAANDSLCDLSCGTAALYDISTGRLVSTCSWNDESARAIFLNVPVSACQIFAVSGRTIVWPEHRNDLHDVVIDVKDIRRGFPATASFVRCDTAQTECTAQLSPLFFRINVSRGDFGKYNFTANRAYVRDAPTEILPFRVDGRGSLTSSDAPQADLETFNDGGTFVMYAPKYGSCTRLVLEGHRKCGDGIEYDDTILVNMPITHDEEEAVVSLHHPNIQVRSLVHDFRSAELTDTIYESTWRKNVRYPYGEGVWEYIDRIKISDLTLHCTNGDTAFTVTVDWKYGKEAKYRHDHSHDNSGGLNMLGIQIGDGPVHNLYAEFDGIRTEEWYISRQYVDYMGVTRVHYLEGGHFEVDYLPSEEPRPVYFIYRGAFEGPIYLKFIDKVFTLTGF